MKTPVIIGIAGGTGSGKTTVARAIYDRVGKDRIEWISHDSYYATSTASRRSSGIRSISIIPIRSSR